MPSDTAATLLSRAREFYRKVCDVYRASNYDKEYSLNELWGSSNMEAMLAILQGSATAVDAIHAVQRTQLFSVNSSDAVRVRAVDWLLEDQKKRGLDLFKLPEEVQESVFSCPSNNVLANGRRLTADFLRTVSIANEIGRRCALPTGARIIELGGGCGHLARTLRLTRGTKTHVIVDLPESLCFSYMFLRLNFPEAKALYVTEPADLDGRDLDDLSFVFVPTKFADLMAGRPFDLFVNTASLGEMSNVHIRYWMNFVQQRLNVRHLYCLNRYLNTIILGKHDWRLDENECSVLYDAGWTILDWELEPPFTRCPYSDTLIARYLQVVAERHPAPDRSRLLLAEVMEQDWVRLESSHPPEMTYRDNILVNDTAMTGTLFKLWESIRLNPTAAAVELMLKHLDTLMHRSDRQFEETFFYEKRLRELCEAEGTPFPEWVRQRQQTRLANTSPLLVQEDYNGFNIVSCAGKFYGISQEIGPVNIQKLSVDGIDNLRRSRQWIVGRSIFEVKQSIDAWPASPRLVQEDYKGFNLVQFRGVVYALDRAWGPIDVRAIPPDLLSRCIAADSAESARCAIDSAAPTKRQEPSDRKLPSLLGDQG